MSLNLRRLIRKKIALRGVQPECRIARLQLQVDGRNRSFFNLDCGRFQVVDFR